MQKNNIQNGKKQNQQQAQAQATLNAFNEICGIVVSGDPIDDSLCRIASIVSEVMNAKGCAVMLYDRERQEFSVKAAQGAFLDLKNRVSMGSGDSICGEAIREKKVVTYRENGKVKRPILPGTPEFADIKSMISAPIMVNGEPIGVINTYRGETHDYSDDEKNAMQAMAGQSAAAIQLSKLMEEIISAKEKLTNRKLIEKAKGILMKQRHMTEAQAYRSMRTKSMETCKPMKEIAEAIIMTMELRPEG